MSTTGTEKHCRLCLMLNKGGTKACHSLLLKRVEELSPSDHQPYPWTIHEFLQSKKKEMLKSNISKEKIQVLFPRTGVTDLAKWDLSLFCTILITYCGLKPLTRLDVERLRTLRNGLCHMNDINIDDVIYNDNFETIKVVVTRILESANDNETKRAIEKILNDIHVGPLSLGETLKEMRTFYLMEWDIRGKLEELKDAESRLLQSAERIENELGSSVVFRADSVRLPDENKSQCWEDVETVNDAQSLFDKGLFPDRHRLSVMVLRHGMKSKIVVLVCENICQKIAASSPEFLHVFGAYDKENRLHFVVYSETESIPNSELHFDYEILFRSCKTNEQQRDQKHIIAESEGELLEEESVALRKTVNSISKRFMEKHKYLSVITARKILCEGGENLCIVMYVHPCTDRYSSIPHTEEPLPTEIQGYKVVVRNGVFKTAAKTAAEYHDNLRMGCQITSNHVIGFGTLGGFIDHPEYGLCGFSCAHVVCSLEQMVNLKRNKRLKWSTLDHSSVYQPSQYTMPVGRVVEAIYTEGGDSGSAGVDLALFQIENRPPVSGKFPRCNSNEKLRYDMGKTWGKSRITPSAREVKKFGVATGITQGNVGFDGMSVRELSFVTKSALQSVDTILYNQYEIVNEAKNFCEKGDSGGLVFMKDSFNELICIGMVNGVLDTVHPFHGVVTPITDILRELNVQNLKPLKKELTLDDLEKRLSEHATATQVKIQEAQLAIQRDMSKMYALLQKQTTDSSTKAEGNNRGDK